MPQERTMESDSEPDNQDFSEDADEPVLFSLST
jgi:hypothetical protein